MKIIKLILLISVFAYAQGNANVPITKSGRVLEKRISSDSLPLRKGRFTPFGKKRAEKFSIPVVTPYPNPANATVRFKSTKPLAGFDLEIIDRNGVSYVKKESWRDEMLDISHLKSGIYIVCFTKGKEKYSQKLLIQKQVP